MALIEIGGRSYYEQGQSGATGHREFMCGWEERLDVGPKIGDLYPGSTLLRCVKLRFEPRGVEQTGVIDPGTMEPCEYTHAYIYAEYAMAPEIDGELVWRYDGSFEQLETGRGRTWDFDSTVCKSPISVPYPLVGCSATYVTRENPLDAILPIVGKVNSNSPWHPTANSPSLAVHTLLCLNPEVVQWYDTERSYVLDTPVYLYRVTLNLLWRPIDHNLVWRSDIANYDQFTDPLYDEADFDGLLGW